MIISNMSKTYLIKDKSDRTWGTFSVEKVINGMSHGYLEPTSQFESIYPIFKEHEKVFFDTEADTEVTIDKITALGAYLIDESSGKKIDINNIIFINENYLVTCEIPKN